MGFHAVLNDATRAEREELFRIPFVVAALEGRLTRARYVHFLTQAYHHVKHTVPLLMATGAHLPDRAYWMQPAVCEYIDEEKGHDAWILADIEACGGDAEAVRRGEPDLPCELMVAYAYDLVRRRNPLGFFGMVHVLEGTSARAALEAADALETSLGLPRRAFTYLRSHGELDQEHVRFFADLMDRVEAEDDRRDIVRAARAFFHLYGNIFRGLLPAAVGGEQ